MIKRLIDFNLNESNSNLDVPGLVSIDDFLIEIGTPEEKIPEILEWWKSNREEISIYYFPFKTNEPISGVFLGENGIAINKKTRENFDFKLFISLHESFHCDQEKNGEMEEYFNIVKNGSIGQFSDLYRRIEKGANDFAIESMKELGFSLFVNYFEMRLRSNEYAGPQVYHMIRRDIEKTGAKDFNSLLFKQIL